MQTNSINIIAIQQFINQVKSAENSSQREIRMDISSAKNLSHTLALVMTRLAGNYEDLLRNNQKTEEVITVRMDGGNWNDK